MLRRVGTLCVVLGVLVALAPAVILSWALAWSLFTHHAPPWFVLASEPPGDAAVSAEDDVLRFEVTIPADADSSYRLGQGSFVARLEPQPVLIRIRRASPLQLSELSDARPPSRSRPD